METLLTEEKIELKISIKNIPFVMSALESEIEHLKKIQKACIKKKQFRAADDLQPGITLLENMTRYLKPLRQLPLALK